MDEVLTSNPAAFRMLRAFWKLSFIKFDDEENQAFRDTILKRNQANLLKPSGAVFDFMPCHSQVAVKLSPAHRFESGIKAVVANCASGTELRHEMALEAGILHQLFNQDQETCNVFGVWDYLSHQVPASPFKPIDYMDKMDLFGYAYLPGFKPTKSRFLVGEVKRELGTTEHLPQLMKYFDWVKDEYCHGDFEMIHAFLIAHEFDADVVQQNRAIGVRKYIVGVRPALSLEWHNLTLVRYYNSGSY